MRPPAVGAAGGAIGDDSCELYCWDDDDDCEVRLARWRGCMDESVRAPLCTIGGVADARLARLPIESPNHPVGHRGRHSLENHVLASHTTPYRSSS